MVASTLSHFSILKSIGNTGHYSNSNHAFSQRGYPQPGVQDPDPVGLIDNCLFMDDKELLRVQAEDDIDYIVVGSGCTAFTFIDEVLQLNPHKKILCLERGGFLLPTHFQNLPAPFKELLGRSSETYPWAISGDMHQSSPSFCHGYYPFFGGRSLFWSGWSPQPTPEYMRDYPRSMRISAKSPDFWQTARHSLKVVRMDRINDGIYNGKSNFQSKLTKYLQLPMGGASTLNVSEPAYLAVAAGDSAGKLKFEKFATSGPLLSLKHLQEERYTRGSGSRLLIASNCVVERLHQREDGSTYKIDTSRGSIKWTNPKTKVVLCGGAIPNTTILLNSFPRMSNTAGKRLTGHFVSHVTARIPLRAFFPNREPEDRGLEIAAHNLMGKFHKERLQYQIQITALHAPNPERDIELAARECPNYSASATPMQLKGSEEYILLICATLGETSENNTQNWLRFDELNPDVTTNVKLQYLLSDTERELWNYMEDETYNVLSVLANDAPIEFWNNERNTWVSQPPSQDEMRMKGIVHEASCSFVGPEEEGGSLDEMYRPHGSTNVHVTGAGIFPNAGAWNPTLTMCAYGQDLARKLTGVPL